MIALEVFVQGKCITFYFEFRLVFTVRHVFCLLQCRSASRQPITSIELKFVPRKVVASVIIRATKPKFAAESRTRVYLSQHVASTFN